MTPFVTSLPSVGQLFQQLSDGSFKAITSVPVQVTHPAGQVLYRAPESVEVRLPPSLLLLPLLLLPLLSLLLLLPLLLRSVLGPDCSYVPLQLNDYGKEATCVSAGFRVHNGKVASNGEASISVDVVQDQRLCNVRPESMASCWQVLRPRRSFTFANPSATLGLGGFRGLCC